MSTSLRRAVGGILIVAFFGGAFLFDRLDRQRKADESVAEARKAAEGAAPRAADAVTSLVDRAADVARDTARSQSLGTVVTAANNDFEPLQSTLKDLLVNEEEFAQFRNGASRLQLHVGEELVASSADPLPKESVASVLARARVDGEAKELRVLENRLETLAAVKLKKAFTVQAQAIPIVLVLARVVDDAALGASVGGLGHAVAISNGNSVLAKAGPTDELGMLAKRVGTERVGTYVGADGSAAVRELGSGLWLWVFHPVAAAPAGGAGTSWTWLVYLTAALLALGTGALLFPRGEEGRGAPATTELHQAQLIEQQAQLLQRQQQEFERISQRMTSTGEEPTVSVVTDPNADAFAATAQTNVQTRYQIVAPLGEGGMARVFVAQTKGAEGFKRLFVLKRLRPEMSDHAEVVTQFIDEARLGASLVHSNIVPVFDFGRDAEGYFMAQEFILGRDVDGVVRTSVAKFGRTLDVEVILYIAQEALKALGYAHAKSDETGRPMRLVHRDVSPNNLMISADGELKLLDFGIVKADNKLTKTQEGIVKGNVFFMSPEQARGLPVDLRADLFSLGLVIYAAAAATPLYTGKTNYDLLLKAGGGLGDEDWARVSALPEPIATLLKKALQFDPNERFQNAEEFAAAIPTAKVAPVARVRALMTELFSAEFANDRNRFSSPSST